MPKHDNHDNLAALDFLIADEPDDHSTVKSAALDFSVGDDGGAGSVLGALHTHAPAEPEGSGSVLGALNSMTEAEEEMTEEEREEDAVQLFTVLNPPRTVSVSASMGGRTQQVKLSSKVTNMSESQLADEILVLAGLARQKGQAGQLSYVLENEFVAGIMREMGASESEANDAISAFMVGGLGLPTPEQAEAAQAEVFATRYAHHPHD